MYVCLKSIYLSIYLSTHQSIHLSIYIYIYKEREIKKNARMDNFWRKKDKKFNKNVSVRDLLQLFTKISERNVFIQFYIFFTSEVVHPRIF